MATRVKSARGEATADICIYALQLGHTLLHGYIVNGGTDS